MNCPYCNNPLRKDYYDYLVVKCDFCPTIPQFIDWDKLLFSGSPTYLAKAQSVTFQIHCKHRFWSVTFFPFTQSTNIYFSLSSYKYNPKNFVQNLNCPFLTSRNVKSFLNKIIKLKTFL